VCFSGPNRAEHDIADGGRQNVLGADLKDTQSAGTQGGEHHAEIQIVRENNPAVSRGRPHEQSKHSCLAGMPQPGGAGRIAAQPVNYL